MTQEQEAQEAMEENENEHYTQSFEYISEEEAGPQWQEEGEENPEGTGNLERGEEYKEPEKKPGQTRRSTTRRERNFWQRQERRSPQRKPKDRKRNVSQDAHRQEPRLEILY